MKGSRRVLLEAYETVLKRITVANGFNTDAGDSVTIEPMPEQEADADAYVAAVWMRQERASDTALQRTHRLTTVHVYAKVPAELEDAQEQLDLLVDDIEAAFQRQQGLFPTGFEFPRYQFAEPLAGQITAGWVGAQVVFTSHIPIRRPAA